MPAYLSNPSDWVKISLIAFGAVIVINKLLEKTGATEFKV